MARAAGPPLLSSAWVSEVGAGSARLNAQLSANGEPSSARFQYIPAAAYQANLGATPPRGTFTGALSAPSGSSASIGSSATPQRFSQGIGGLAPSTAYRYRVLASNGEGSVTGPAMDFTTTERTGAFALPDERGWEMVSPVDKNGGQVAAPESVFGGGIFQAAAQGDAVTYTAATAFGEAAGAPGASQYLARRGEGGWMNEDLTPPLLSGSYESGPGAGVPYRLFADDLGAGLLANGRRCRAEGSDCPVANPPLPGSGAPAGYRNYYLREGDGSFRALLGAGSLAGQDPARFEVVALGATSDLSRVLLSSCAALTADATEASLGGGECDPAKPNLYVASAAGLEAVNLLPGDTETTPGAEPAAAAGTVASGASRTYWTAAGNLYLREGGQSKQVDSAVGGGGTFQAASANGAIAYFTKAEHLYRYLAATGTATDLTPGGGVIGVLGAGADGTGVYYLTAAGLFLSREGTATRIAAGADLANLPPATGAARVSADGAHLAFVSSPSLTGYDNQGMSEVYLYGPPPAGGPALLVCASCNPTGERPLGPSSIPGAVANGSTLRAYKPRALAADGSRLFFDSSDALSPRDTNNAPDVYEWEAGGVGSCQAPNGCIGLVSGGKSEGGASFVDASADGSDAFFLTAGSLVPADSGGVDLYDARVGGGFPVPEPAIPCLGDACQPLPPEPEDPVPGTLLARPGANPPLSIAPAAKQQRKKKYHKRRKAHRRHGVKGKRR